MNRTIRVLVTASGLLTANSAVSIVKADAAPPIQTEKAPTVQRLIRIKNVEPEVMAWWLDPSHNEMPIQLVDPSHPPKPKSEVSKEPAKIEGAFTLPAGVLSITPIIPQNTILVTGTEQGIEDLGATIAFLDRPLRQIEIEAQFVQISEEDMKELGIDLGANEPGQMKVGFVRGNYRQTLDKLVAEKKVVLMGNYQITAINNRVAQIAKTLERPAVIGFKDEGDKFQELTATGPKDSLSRLQLETSFRFTVTPTINNDDTLTLLMAPERVLRLNDSLLKESFDLKNLDGVKTIANVKDGDTIALSGLSSKLFTEFNEAKGLESNVALIVTARVVRRASAVGIKTVSLPK